MNGPLLALAEANFPTGGTGVFASHRLCLLEGGGFQGSRGQPLDGGGGHLFHLVHINVQTRPLLAKSMPDNNFSPLLGDFPDTVQVRGGQLS